MKSNKGIFYLIALVVIGVCIYGYIGFSVYGFLESDTDGNASIYNYEEDYSSASSSSYSYSDYEEKEEGPNHPSWCFGSWRIQIDDVNVMIATIYNSEVSIQIMHGFSLADKEILKNWTVENGVLYMYNGSNKYGGYSFSVDERNKTLYHNGRAMQKH